MSLQRVSGRFIRSGTVITHHRSAKRSLERCGSAESRRGLDWMNFFTADAEVGFGSFVSFYLASMGWSQENVGLAMTAGRLAGAALLIPGGALTDTLPWKRGLAAAGLLMIASAALILALKPDFLFVVGAEILQGASGGLVGPAVAAISLGIVGQRAMSARTGRNKSLSGAGTALTALSMGTLASYFGASTIFLIAAALGVPALVALSFIRSDEIDYARARNAEKQDGAPRVRGLWELARNRQLFWFTGCLFLFQLADASMLPLATERIGGGGAAQGSLLTSALIATPQAVVAILAPWSGYFSELWGRKPLLLAGFCVEIVRAGLFGVIDEPILWIPVQLLDGVSSAILTVLTIVVVMDLTSGTGRFNLARGLVGLASTAAAALSLTAFGFVAQEIARWAAFVSMAAVTAAGALLMWFMLGETKPAKYID